MTQDWESRAQAQEESSVASSPSGEETDWRGDEVPCAPTPEKIRQVSDEVGTSLHACSGPKGRMDTECPAQMGTEWAMGQDAAHRHLYILRSRAFLKQLSA